MRQPTPQFQALFEVLNFTSKRELVKHCKNLVVHQEDLVALILAAQHGALAPYRYANHFARSFPEALLPNENEHDAIAVNGVGAYKSKEARKFASKVFQLFKDQRALVAHMFFTPSHQFWHLFYFDNRDTAEDQNHWKHGSHIHFVSDLWTELSFEAVWQQVVSGELSLPSKLHLRYRRC